MFLKFVAISLHVVYLSSIFSNNFGFVGSNCFCKNQQLCRPIHTNFSKEVFIFSLHGDNWERYDWTRISTIVQFGFHNDTLVCYAHARGVKIVSLANIPAANLTNKWLRSKWVNETSNFVIQHHLDGVNVDFEYPINATSYKQRSALTSVVKQLTHKLKSKNPLYQVSFDVAWSSEGIDGRFYDYKGLADATDFLFVMSYDERSQIRGSCIAWANSALNNTVHGVLTYLKLGISPLKLVLGVPWYGYRYQCVRLINNVCYIKMISFRGSKCSDAAGKQWNYGNIMQLKNARSLKSKWDVASQSPFFTYTDDNSYYQLWFDNPRSLQLKINFAGKAHLRGVGMWNSDALDYHLDARAENQSKEMWHTLPRLQ